MSYFQQITKYIKGIKDMVFKESKKNTFRIKKMIMTSSPRGYILSCHKDKDAYVSD
jgi:hypothetical protein